MIKVVPNEEDQKHTSGNADVFKELSLDVFTYTDVNKVQEWVKPNK